MIFAGFLGTIGGGITVLFAIVLGLIGIGLVWKGKQCQGKSQAISDSIRYGYGPKGSAGGCLGALAGGCLLPIIGLGLIAAAFLLAAKGLEFMGIG